MRLVENIGFIAAIAIAMAYGFAEAAARVGLCSGSCSDSVPFPWGLLLVLITLAIPKVLGKATAGRIWDALANRFGGKAGTP